MSFLTPYGLSFLNLFDVISGYVVLAELVTVGLDIVGYQFGWAFMHALKGQIDVHLICP